MIPWWLGFLFFLGGGFFGLVIIAVFAAHKMKELTLANRRFRDQRDQWKREAREWRKKLGESEKELAEIKAGEGFPG